MLESGDHELYWRQLRDTASLRPSRAIAAELIGARQHAASFKEFAHIGLGDDLTLDADARDARVDSMSETEHDALGALDESFYALPSINGYLTAYVELHPSQFFRD